MGCEPGPGRARQGGHCRRTRTSRSVVGAMIRGVRQLKELTVTYCGAGGSSRGVRDFLHGDRELRAALGPGGSLGPTSVMGSGLRRGPAALAGHATPEQGARTGTWLGRFRGAFPEVDVKVQGRRNATPTATGVYRNGRRKTIQLSNWGALRVAEALVRLAESSGVPANTRIASTARHETRKPSVQGRWTPELQRKLLREDPH